MKRLLLCLALLAACIFGTRAFEWPLEDPTVTATFGEHRGDHFHSGVDLGGGEQPVFPIANGELVYFYEEGSGSGLLPSGLGNYVVLQHQGGIRSLYSHLKGGSLAELQKSVTGKTRIGLVGESGYSAGKHLHLSIIDTEMGTVINPFLVLPPVSDKQIPTIKDVYVRRGRELIRLADKPVLRRGEVEVLASVYDVRPDVSFLWRMAPYKVYLYQDGREKVSLVFGSFHERRAGSRQTKESTFAPGTVSELTLVGGEQSFQAVYEDQWLFRLGFVTLTPGETTLEVFAADFSGNESSREFQIRVTE